MSQNELYDRILHLQDRVEKIRGHALNTIRGDLTLLQEALVANLRTPTKTNVVDDHLDRVIESLTRCAQKLEDL